LHTNTFPLLDIPIGAITMEDAIEQVNFWVTEGRSGHIVTFANVHMLVESKRDPAVHEILRNTDLNCPDGAPLAWIGRKHYDGRVTQVAGPDFMPLFCSQALGRGYRHYLYGGAPGIVEMASRNLAARYPGIQIVGMYTPPFRQLLEEEDNNVCKEINASGADLVWVCLGCPKQEKWMYAHRDLLNAKVLLGVGQAIDIIAGKRDRAPSLFRRAGLEWFYRLWCEPSRLWRRYLITNILFVIWTAKDALSRTLNRLLEV
jgi:N-acetylglucosaminyldiphosphoundecaprenol N-acetyl-beta-D-mannosaminyltransferase